MYLEKRPIGSSKGVGTISLVDKASLSIVIVSDKKLIRTTLKVSLNKAGYENIRSSRDPQHALKLLREQPADVVVADWLLPGMDGLTLTSYLREQDEGLNHYTAILLYTAKDAEDNIAQAFAQGVDDYLVKPIADGVLAARIYGAGRIATLQNTLFKKNQKLAENATQLAQQSMIDSLTGMGNQRYFINHLARFLRDAKARDRLIVCTTVGIDQFQVIIDAYGERAADEVIAKIAGRLRNAVRPVDIVSRVGQSEFGVLMYYSDAAGYDAQIFQRIANQLSRPQIETSSGNITVTTSLGVCTYSQENLDVDAETLLKCSIGKLFSAQNIRGGNCTLA